MKTVASADMNVLGGNVWVQQFSFLKKKKHLKKEQKVDLI